MSAASLRVYGADLVFDPKLRRCSRAARSFWTDLFLVVLNAAKPRGYLLDDAGARLTIADLAKIFGDSEDDIEGWLKELTARGAAFVTDLAHPLGAGVIYCKRMAVKEPEKAARDVANGKLGGNPELVRQRVLIDGALRDAMKRDRAAERQRRHRERRKVGRSANETCHALSRSEAETSNVTRRDKKRDVFQKKPTKKGACENVTGVNPHNLILKEIYSETLRSVPPRRAGAAHEGRRAPAAPDSRNAGAAASTHAANVIPITPSDAVWPGAMSERIAQRAAKRKAIGDPL